MKTYDIKNKADIDSIISENGIEKEIYFFEDLLYPVIYEVNYEKEYIINYNWIQ